MNTSPSQAGETVAWLLVAIQFSLLVAFSAVLLKIKEKATPTAAVTSAAVAFAGTLALLLPMFSTVGLL
ncbi:hypothetical protein OHB41_31895 [Streptomyces sp. NBC_01571]|uniref:hypothetical protein n=1 Tax=Streptomyces sp. NBC_01571 TaxID=2975883 RepID=UPI0022553D6F|nr:hypothetical protein [Streptomyces sp. NBC_01571]MCX4577709.1 hypothetical protein [Streptomyces sp. NBC_01571]